MAILNVDGDIEQIGTPKEIYEFPVSSFVANFVGTTNIIKGIVHIVDTHAQVTVTDLGVFEVLLSKFGEWVVEGGDVLMSVRPEKIEISKQPLQGFANHVVGIVQSIIYTGRSTVYHVCLANGFMLQVFEQNEEHFPQEIIDYDDQVHLYWQKENVVLLEK